LKPDFAEAFNNRGPARRAGGENEGPAIKLSMPRNSSPSVWEKVTEEKGKLATIATIITILVGITSLITRYQTQTPAKPVDDGGKQQPDCDKLSKGDAN
jgi:hypothetical protein